ncbi:unnamed protein product [Urochloa decumbens]|uniref:Uncharacterized protein n=1 Tax=Urochloa decumbens TaxID=240449 RepID=A0ABC8ZDU8_9POAL
MVPPPSASASPRLWKMMAIMSLGFLFLVALASPASAARVESWSGGVHRRSAVVMAAPGGRADALPPAALPTDGDGVLAPPPAAPDAPPTSTSQGAPPPTGSVAAKPRRLVPLPPSGPSVRGHV